jgi:acyl-CoA thioester hydrolase
MVKGQAPPDVPSDARVDVPPEVRVDIAPEVRVDIRVIYGDTDQMGVVYYANYLRARGLRYRDFEAHHRVFLPVVEAHVAYKAPARYDDLLAVHAGITRVGRASARFEYRVLRDETLIATGHTVHACVNAAGAVQALPAGVRDLLLPPP